MNRVIQDLQKLTSWKQLMRASCKANQLKTVHANELTLIKLKSLHLRLIKSYQHLGYKVANVWIENELKTFNWLLIAISGLQGIPITNFKQEQWQLLESIFQHKKRTFLKFQAHKLVSTKLKNKHWTKQQNDLLLKIVKQNNDDNYQWNDIARKMFDISQQKIFRTGKHCREHWLNHLDPSKERGRWTKDEDGYLLGKVQEAGKKWSQYASYLNRTEHTVKNRFNSLIIKQKRQTPQFKKQEKLIEELLKNIHNNPQYSQPPSQAPDSQSMSVKQEVQEQSQKNVESQRAEVAQDVQVEVERSKPREANQEVKMKQTIPEQDFSQDPELLKFTKDQEQIKSTNFNQFGLYSPYWNYSPSNNGTPNNFMNSPSPVSFFINTNFNSNFNNYYRNWITNLSNPATPAEENP